MPVFEGSRYENALVLRVKNAEGVYNPALYSMISASAYEGQFSTHVVQAGERFDTLANQLYGDPELWWILANVNPEYLFPELPEGVVIRVPRVST